MRCGSSKYACKEDHNLLPWPNSNPLGRRCDGYTSDSRTYCLDDCQAVSSWDDAGYQPRKAELTLDNTNAKELVTLEKHNGHL